ncbi:MAG: hypothetical protein E7163_06020 [Firmicutes bacterium]|mgnify:CR=1 FL=1|nr:hypothetical protein [Bacillota bacterium]
MEHNIIEEKRNKLNLDIRGLLTVIDLIDGNKKEYEDYITDSLNEIEFLDQQIKLVNEAKERLISVFKD